MHYALGKLGYDLLRYVKHLLLVYYLWLRLQLFDSLLLLLLPIILYLRLYLLVRCSVANARVAIVVLVKVLIYLVIDILLAF